MKRIGADDRQLEVAVGAMSQSCRSGETLISGLRSANQRHPTCTITEILRLHETGLTLRVACNRLIAESATSSDSTLAAHVIGLAAEVGGPAERHLDALAHTLADRRHAAADRRVHASTARASIRVMTGVPFLVGCWLAYGDPAFRRTIFGTTAGITCLSIGVVLNLAGRLWAGHIVRAT